MGSSLRWKTTKERTENFPSVVVLRFHAISGSVTMRGKKIQEVVNNEVENIISLLNPCELHRSCGSG